MSFPLMMSCKRNHAIAFHLANPICDIALESAEEVKESCPGFAWVGRNPGPPMEIRSVEPPQRSHNLLAIHVRFPSKDCR